MSEHTATPTVTRLVSLAQLTIAKNVRTETGLDKASIGELAESIKVHGLLQPILIAKAGDGYAVIAGQRRTLAAQVAGLTEIPAIEVDGNDGADLKAKQIVENLQRENLSLAETCAAVREMLAMLGKPANVAATLKKHKSWVSKHLTPTGPSFPAEVRELMADGSCQDLETLLILGQIAKKPGGANVLPALIEQAREGNLTRNKATHVLADLKDEQAEPEGEGDEAGDGEGDGGAPAEKFGRLELAEGPARKLLAALKFAKEKKPSSRPDDALILHVEDFIEKTWPKQQQVELPV